MTDQLDSFVESAITRIEEVIDRYLLSAPDSRGGYRHRSDIIPGIDKYRTECHFQEILTQGGQFRYTSRLTVSALAMHYSDAGSSFETIDTFIYIFGIGSSKEDCILNLRKFSRGLPGLIRKRLAGDFTGVFLPLLQFMDRDQIISIIDHTLIDSILSE